jgi:thiamine biosynthesis protein ThiI
MIFPIVLVRFGEIALKSRNTRMTLRRLLRHNVLTVLKVNGLQVERIEDTWDRLIIYTDASDKVAQVLSKVFGVVSTSASIECKSEINDIAKIVSEMARENLKQGDRFAIRVRRVGKHEFTTHQVASTCGSSVIQTAKEAGIQVSVDLESPDHEFFIEVRDKRSFLYGSVVRGVGGLPLGSQGKIVSLLTDYGSIIATWLVMKRGCTPIVVVFDTKEQFQDLINTVKVSLLPFSLGELRIVILPFTEMNLKTDSSVLQKCLEFLAVNDIASLEGAAGIVTSERLDPSSSKELERLEMYGGFVQFPVFYPLIGLGEEDLNSLVETIGEGTLTLRGNVVKPSAHIEDTTERISSDIDDSLKEYREKIRRMVMAAVEKGESDEK